MTAIDHRCTSLSYAKKLHPITMLSLSFPHRCGRSSGARTADSPATRPRPLSPSTGSSETSFRHARLPHHLQLGRGHPHLLVHFHQAGPREGDRHVQVPAIQSSSIPHQAAIRNRYVPQARYASTSAINRITAEPAAPETKTPNSGITHPPTTTEDIDTTDKAMTMLKASTGMGQRSVQRICGSRL